MRVEGFAAAAPVIGAAFPHLGEAVAAIKVSGRIAGAHFEMQANRTSRAHLLPASLADLPPRPLYGRAPDAKLPA